MLHEKIEEIIRERFPGGTALEELATLQLVTSLTGQQTMDASTILPLLLLGGGGSSLRGPSGRMALLALAMTLSQQSQMTGAVVPGTAPPPANNWLPMLLALGLFEERPSPFRRLRSEEREEELAPDRERAREEETEHALRGARRKPVSG
jgi:hypothetical protein